MIGSKCGALQSSATHWSLALKTHTCFYHQQQVVTVTAGDTSFNLKIVLCVFAVVSSKTCFMNVGRFQQTESTFVCDSCFLAHVAHSSCNMMTKVSRVVKNILGTKKIVPEEVQGVADTLSISSMDWRQGVISSNSC